MSVNIAEFVVADVWDPCACLFWGSFFGPQHCLPCCVLEILARPEAEGLV